MSTVYRTTGTFTLEWDDEEEMTPAEAKSKAEWMLGASNDDPRISHLWCSFITHEAIVVKLEDK